ncbi:MAG TPA: cyanophycin synthetase [Candidatus Paceibacterota bacterium]|nr:cyanophycin synthetase [Verrucomicrobiota bacterium]HRZ45769.1 cyanophycin synthetase [Candidatus Paceibacterota bacterium]
MLLRHLAASLNIVRTQGSLDREVRSLALDSQRTASGSVFVALPNPSPHSGESIQEAVDRGAVAVVCQCRGVFAPRATVIQVPDAREALLRLAEAFFQHPGAKLQTIHVAGASAAAPVAFILREILEAAGDRTGLISSIHHQLGDRVLPAWFTPPTPLETQALLAQMVRIGCRFCVLEQPAAAPHLQGIDVLLQHQKPGWFVPGAIPPVSPPQLGPSIDRYRTRQASLTVHQVPPAPALPGARIGPIETLVSYGARPWLRLEASSLTLSPGGARFQLHTPAARMTCRLPSPGQSHVQYALAAAGIALALGVDPSIVRRALCSLPPVPGRLEPVDAGQPFSVLVDRARRPDDLRDALQSARAFTAGRLLLATGSPGGSPLEERIALGEVAARIADLTVLTSDNSSKESPDLIACQILAGYHRIRSNDVAIEHDRQQAIRQLIRQARPGDTVLLAGKGNETIQIDPDTLLPFDDRVFAREMIEESGFAVPARRHRLP